MKSHRAFADGKVDGLVLRLRWGGGWFGGVVFALVRIVGGRRVKFEAWRGRFLCAGGQGRAACEETGEEKKGEGELVWDHFYDILLTSRLFYGGLTCLVP